MTQYQQIRHIIAQSLCVPLELVTPKASFVHDLGASLDVVEMIMECEREFHLAIPDEDAAQLVTVGQLAAYIGLKTQPEGTVWPPSPSEAAR